MKLNIKTSIKKDLWISDMLIRWVSYDRLKKDSDNDKIKISKDISKFWENMFSLINKKILNNETLTSKDINKMLNVFFNILDTTWTNHRLMFTNKQAKIWLKTLYKEINYILDKLDKDGISATESTNKNFDDKNKEIFNQHLVVKQILKNFDAFDWEQYPHTVIPYYLDNNYLLEKLKDFDEVKFKCYCPNCWEEVFYDFVYFDMEDMFIECLKCKFDIVDLWDTIMTLEWIPLYIIHGLFTNDTYIVSEKFNIKFIESEINEWFYDDDDIEEYKEKWFIRLNNKTKKYKLTSKWIEHFKKSFMTKEELVNQFLFKKPGHGSRSPLYANTNFEEMLKYSSKEIEKNKKKSIVT